MTGRIGWVLIALATVGLTLASATESQARGRRHRGNGSCGSWGGGHGSNGGSFGGMFSRWRNGGSHGGWGTNGGHGSRGGWGSNGGHGSHGGYSHGGHASHGGYANGGQVHVEYGTPSEARSANGEVRYYGERIESARPMDAPAPIMEDQNRPDGAVDDRVNNGRAADDMEPPRRPAPEGAGTPGGGLQNRDQPPGTNQQDQIQDEAAPPATGTGT